MFAAGTGPISLSKVTSEVHYGIWWGQSGTGLVGEKETRSVILIHVPHMEENSRYGEGGFPPNGHELKERSWTMRSRPVPCLGLEPPFSPEASTG